MKNPLLKVLYVAPEFPNYGENAAQVRANQLLSRLSKQVDLHVLGYRPEGVIQKGTYRHEMTIVPRKVMNVVELVKGTFSLNPRAFRRYMHAEAVDTFKSLLADFEPDIVHFDSIGTVGLLKYAEEANCAPKIVIHSHDSVSRLYESQLHIHNKLLFVDRYMQWQKILRVESMLYKKASICIVDSAEDAAYISSLNKKNTVRVLPLGFDERVYGPTGSLAEIAHPSIVFSGSMHGIQSVDAALYLINAVMPIVWGSIPNAHLYLVGGQRTKQLTVFEGEHVHVTGFVDDLAGLLRAADVYVCPLKVGSGMRTRVLEALACECAVISTLEGVTGILPSSQSDLPWSLASTAEDFAEKVVGFLSVPESGKRMRKCAGDLAREKYSWDSITEKLLKEYMLLI